MAQTKIAKYINKSDAYEKLVRMENTNDFFMSLAQKGIESFDVLYEEIEVCWDNFEALHYKDGSVIFYPRLNLIMENKEALKINLDLYGGNNLDELFKDSYILKKWESEFLSSYEAFEIFFEYDRQSRPYNYTQLLCSYNDKIGYIKSDGKFYSLKVKEVNQYEELVRILSRQVKSSIYADKISSVRAPLCYHFNSADMTKLQILLEIGKIPDELDSKVLFRNLLGLIKSGYVQEKKGKLLLTPEGKKAVIDGVCTKIGNVLIKADSKNRKKENKFELNLSKLDESDKKSILNYYAECDKLRANTNLYDLKWLEDINQGHWELWDGNMSDDIIELHEGSKIYARNPSGDVQKDSVVGIDFGTKSTVVVFQDDSSQIKPMLVGTGNYKNIISSRDFENPTVMQFVDLQKFINDYQSRDGRPFTKWKDLMVSHAANESMKDTSVRSDEFYSYLYDLKQWAGNNSDTIFIRDKKQKDYILPSYEKSVNESNLDFDPIEVYAYYIGLYINNMNNGIFTNYLLSFPVTYEKSIRQSILKSFEKGLKKSFPPSVLNDEKVMNDFKVIAGASEPAAYAICALQQYGFDLIEKDKAFYAIFDFGGGTSDFDFGSWRNPEDEELYDYCIEHFGSEGDRYLGGENLLQLIAFDVFRQNINVCRKESIVFSAPSETKSIPSELKGYVNSSQEARLNLKLMIEKLRPFWERSDDTGEVVTDIAEFSEFQISLFNSEGKITSNLSFDVDIERLDKILTKRIEKGVRQFFNSLMNVFRNKYIDKTADVDVVNIFLAGNSSKSPLMIDIFNKYIVEYNKQICELTNEDDTKQYFVLYPPLGTEQAKIIQKQKGVILSEKIENPNGKTGVAWGLIEGREGGRIEVKEEISFEKEAKFAYNLGFISKQKFKPKLERDIQYNQWYQFYPARGKIVEIAYTSLPEALSGNLSANDENVRRKRVNLNKNGDGMYLFLKPISRTSVLCGVGETEEKIDNSTIEQIDF